MTQTEDSAASKPAAPLTPQAQRALAEAEARRAATGRDTPPKTGEVGREGPDPARYGDWEKNGIASDF